MLSLYRRRRAPKEAATRVLVVDDEEPIASAIERGLTKIGYAVDVAYDGAEALEKAGVNAYDVVCLDLNLPRVDGVEVCRKLRADHFGGEAGPRPVNNLPGWELQLAALCPDPML